MRKSLLLLGVVCFPFLAGCLGTPPPMAQFTSAKGLSNESSTRTLDPVNADYEILGPVDAQGNSQVILGMVFNEGKEGYGLMMQNARSQYGNNVTTILFPMIDYEYKGILYPVFGTMQTNYYGTAVKAEKIEQLGADVAAQEPAVAPSKGLLGFLPF